MCAFLGYTNIHKGYKCLDISTGRVYISHDVVFNEAVFPFADLPSTTSARYTYKVLIPSTGDTDLSMTDSSPASVLHLSNMFTHDLLLPQTIPGQDLVQGPNTEADTALGSAVSFPTQTSVPPGIDPTLHVRLCQQLALIVRLQPGRATSLPSTTSPEARRQ
jgi:hypothetical protein